MGMKWIHSQPQRVTSRRCGLLPNYFKHFSLFFFVVPSRRLSRLADSFWVHEVECSIRVLPWYFRFGGTLLLHYTHENISFVLSYRHCFVRRYTCRVRWLSSVWRTCSAGLLSSAILSTSPTSSVSRSTTATRRLTPGPRRTVDMRQACVLEPSAWLSTRRPVPSTHSTSKNSFAVLVRFTTARLCRQLTSRLCRSSLLSGRTYTGRVAYCLMVSYGEYAPRAL